MSIGKWKREDDPYIQEIISLRKKGYSWSALARYFKKDRTTIMYHWQRFERSKSETKILDEVDGSCLPGNRKKKETLLPSWDGTKHLCCNSFLPKYHFNECPNVAGTWHLGESLKDIRAVAVNKYDRVLDEPKRTGKSYTQYRVR